jgi:hypothetical protein
MILDDVHDLTVSWRRHPPPHLTLSRIEQLLSAVFGAEPRDDTAAPEAPARADAVGWSPERPPQLAPIDEASVRMHVAMVNGGQC